MTAVQNYAGKGNYATALPQQAQNGSLPCPLTDNQIPLTVDPRIMEAQARLLDLEDQYAQRGNYAPVQLVEDLLLHWLITSPEQLTTEADKDQLHVLLMLLDTLEQLYPIDSLPSINRKGNRIEPVRLYKKYTRRLSPDFLNLFELSDEQEARVGLLVMPDERMSPQIRKGSSVVVVSLEAHNYPQATGIVLLATHNAPDQPLSGRIIQNDSESILLLPDDPAFCEIRVEYAAIRFLSQIKYVLNQPIV